MCRRNLSRLGASWSLDWFGCRKSRLRAQASREQIGAHDALALHIYLASFFESIADSKPLPGGPAHLDGAWYAMRLHPARGVHRIADDRIDVSGRPDHPGHDRPTGMDPDPHLEVQSQLGV